MLKKFLTVRLYKCASFIFLCLLLALLSLGCAEVKYCQVTCDDTAKGIRYYDTSPFLLLQHDSTGTNWATQLIYLPDPTKEYQAKVVCWLAANNSTFTFSNSVLANASINADETVIPTTILNALTGVAEQIVGGGSHIGANALTGTNPFQWPQSKTNYPPMDVILFKIVRSNDDWGLEGAGAPKFQ